MTERRHRTGIGHIARILCVLSLVLVGFAHRPVAFVTPAASVDLAAYALPDGSLPALCLAGDTADGKSGAGAAHCEFCRISGSALLPWPQSAADTMFALVAVPEARPADDRRAARVYTPGAPPRGPPLADA